MYALIRYTGFSEELLIKSTVKITEYSTILFEFGIQDPPIPIPNSSNIKYQLMK